jgi:hypothetical protein
LKRPTIPSELLRELLLVHLAVGAERDHDREILVAQPARVKLGQKAGQDGGDGRVARVVVGQEDGLPPRHDHASERTAVDRLGQAAGHDLIDRLRRTTFPGREDADQAVVGDLHAGASGVTAFNHHRDSPLMVEMRKASRRLRATAPRSIGALDSCEVSMRSLTRWGGKTVALRVLRSWSRSGG